MVNSRSCYSLSFILPLTRRLTFTLSYCWYQIFGPHFERHVAQAQSVRDKYFGAFIRRGIYEELSDTSECLQDSEEVCQFWHSVQDIKMWGRSTDRRRLSRSCPGRGWGWRPLPCRGVGEGGGPGRRGRSEAPWPPGGRETGVSSVSGRGWRSGWSHWKRERSLEVTGGLLVPLTWVGSDTDPGTGRERSRPGRWSSGPSRGRRRPRRGRTSSTPTGTVTSWRESQSHLSCCRQILFPVWSDIC